MKKRLIIEPGGGLGNRLLVISSAYNLAKDCGIEDIILLWRNNNECGCDFEDVLGDLPITTRVKTIHFGKESYKTLLKEMRVGSALNKFWQGFFYKLFRIWAAGFQIPMHQDMTVEEQKAISDYVLNSRKDKLYIEAYYIFYGALDLLSVSFNADIMQRVVDYKAAVGNYDAMHIRRTDNVAAIENSPTELFYRKIEEIIHADSNHSIYIATDDLSILKDLKRKYPKNIISEANVAASRTSSEGMKFALYEMLILAGADTLYASYGSTFTIIANAIGGNKMITLSKDV